VVELGFIKTNIGNNRVTAKKSQDANSPYSQLMQHMVSYILYPSVCRANPALKLQDTVSSGLVVLSSLMLVVLVVSSQNTD
jgi:hypothetical protein